MSMVEWDKLKRYVAERCRKMQVEADRFEERFNNTIDGDKQDIAERRAIDATARVEELQAIWDKFFEQGP